jgi:hypothetical protein
VFSHRFVRIDGVLVFVPDEDQEGLIRTRKAIVKEEEEDV